MSAAAETTADPLAEVPPEQRPRHVVIIMDGNGRWAQRRHLPRIEGHRRGAGDKKSGGRDEQGEPRRGGRASYRET